LSKQKLLAAGLKSILAFALARENFCRALRFTPRFRQT